MEDILASIRRILSEDEATAGLASPPAPANPPPPADPDVLALESSMLVAEPPPVAPPPEHVRAASGAESAEPIAVPNAPVPPAAEPVRAGLVAPEAVAATTSSLSTLVRALVEHQAAAVHRGGPTLEDIVREEIRPMLKAWLDQNLPPLVERLVRAEIERVIGRAVS